MLAQVEPKYPSVTVDLAETGGNPISLMSHMRMALRAAKVPAAEVSLFFDEALSQDYLELLDTCARWVRVKPAPIEMIEQDHGGIEQDVEAPAGEAPACEAPACEAPATEMRAVEELAA